MKKTIILILAAALVLALCAAAGGETTEGMPNPWREVTAEELEQSLGVAFGIPEGAENISYAMIEGEGLAEMRFTWYEMDYTARIKPAAAFEDISGLYYDTWDYEDDCTVGYCEGRVMRAHDDEGMVDLCLWYDVAPGLMYSVSAGGRDLDGFDILAAADALFVPMQGDAD